MKNVNTSPFITMKESRCLWNECKNYCTETLWPDLNSLRLSSWFHFLLFSFFIMYVTRRFISLQVYNYKVSFKSQVIEMI